ncbi:hypothetical protein G5V59_16420 [Nocardioides sp. W3-2-3]|nr:hypothetical protein [Nocardioides convexus]
MDAKNHQQYRGPTVEQRDRVTALPPRREPAPAPDGSARHRAGSLRRAPAERRRLRVLVTAEPGADGQRADPSLPRLVPRGRRPDRRPPADLRGDRARAAVGRRRDARAGAERAAHR